MRAWTLHAGAECALDTRTLVLTLVHAHEYVEGGAQFIALEETVARSRQQAVRMLTIPFCERW